MLRRELKHSDTSACLQYRTQSGRHMETPVEELKAQLALVQEQLAGKECEIESLTWEAEEAKIQLEAKAAETLRETERANRETERASCEAE